jgi:hypothetical protein
MLGRIAIVLSLTACAQDVGGGATNLGEPIATMHFDAAWNEWVDGPLYAGRTIEVEYDIARLPCRATRYGRPAWSIIVHYRFDGGAAQQQVIFGHEAYPGANVRTIDLPEDASSLELWFESSSASGCHEWDSDFGNNYRYSIVEDPGAPGWMGNGATVLSRATCEGGPCDSDRRPLEEGFTYGTWTRQRAAIRGAYFDVWKEGVTDHDNPDLWLELDVRVYYRYGATGEWQWAYVDHDRRVGNDARYAMPLIELDPLRGDTRTTREECPAAPLVRDESGQYVRTTMEYFFLVNGHAYRGPGGAPFRGVFEDYIGLYTPCDIGG